MGTQMHEQQISRRIQRIRLVIAVFIVLVVLVGTVFAIWHSQERWGNIPVPTIVSVFFAVLSITFILLQICYPWAYSSGSARTFMPIEPSPPSSRRARLAIPRKSPSLKNYRVSPHIQRLPSTNPQIQKRQKAVEDFYTSLIKEDVTAFVITGIAGIGKSTFATLLSKYAEEQRLAGNAPFKAETLYIEVNYNDTTINLVKVLFTALKRPLPNLKNLNSIGLAE